MNPIRIALVTFFTSIPILPMVGAFTLILSR
jgi:hypothetical protein